MCFTPKDFQKFALKNGKFGKNSHNLLSNRFRALLLRGALGNSLTKNDAMRSLLILKKMTQIYHLNQLHLDKLSLIFGLKTKDDFYHSTFIRHLQCAISLQLWLLHFCVEISRKNASRREEEKCNKRGGRSHSPTPRI